MDIQDAQREVRYVYVGGFWGQLVSSVIWLISAALGTWVTPKASILTIVIAGFFIFPLTQMLLRLSGRRASVSRENSFNSLGMQVAFALPFSMLLLVPVGLYNLNWFFPALMVLLGAHYLPFATLYGMRMFLFLAGILIAMGVVIAHYFWGTFSLGAWVRLSGPVRLRLDWALHHDRRRKHTSKDRLRRHSVNKFTDGQPRLKWEQLTFVGGGWPVFSRIGRAREKS